MQGGFRIRLSPSERRRERPTKLRYGSSVEVVCTERSRYSTVYTSTYSKVLFVDPYSTAGFWTLGFRVWGHGTRPRIRRPPTTMTVQYMCDAESCHTFQCDNEIGFGIYLGRHNYPRNNSILPPTWKLNAINQFEYVIRPASRVNRLRHGRLPLGSGELRLVPRSKLIVKLAEEGLMIFLIWFEICQRNRGPFRMNEFLNERYIWMVYILLSKFIFELKINLQKSLKNKWDKLDARHTPRR